MNVIFRITCLLFFLPLLVSCASSYKSINPETLEYHNQSTNDKIEFSYRYSVLEDSQNKKYVKHEIKNHLNLVAVKITNHTGHEINPMKDIIFYVDKKPVYPVDQKITEREIKQGVPIYLLYLLMSPISIYTSTSTTNGETFNKNSFPIGLIIGPTITATNMIVAGTANKNFDEELEMYSLDKQIRDNETIFALVAFKDIGMDEMALKLK